ncbi:hypothetical protein F5B21DRAFT_458242 [Xylaria acuta]|nr:hypothetical protein F5B21DRAFT_458242 [Xylaria acuta]
MPMILALYVLRCGTKQALGHQLDMTAGHSPGAETLVTLSTPFPWLFAVRQNLHLYQYNLNFSPEPAEGLGPKRIEKIQ